MSDAARFSLFILMTAAAAAGGCSGGPEPILLGTGRTRVAAYSGRGMSDEDAREVARLEAALAAQRDLIERYAVAVLPPEQVDPFLEKVRDRMKQQRGLIRGVNIERARARRGGKGYEVVVTSTLEKMKQALGTGPEPKSPIVQRIRWPDASGGLPD